MNEFRTDLKYSTQSRDKPFWAAFYRKAFPDVKLITPVTDLAYQKRGIDTVVKLANGKLIYIDEKKRRKDYGDILLEYISVDTTNTPGWIEKDLSIDYIAYAIMPTKTVYLFSWDMLKIAWLQFKNEWIDKYPIIEAQNPGYKTISVAVPLNVLKNAVSNASVFHIAKVSPCPVK